MIKTDSFIENRIRWKALQNGFPSKKVMFYEELQIEDLDVLQNTIEKEKIGVPVIFFKGKKNLWTVIGTQKIISGTTHKYSVIENTKIAKHTIGDDPFGIILEQQNKTFRKLKQDSLLVATTNGNIIRLFGPKGKEIFGMHSIVLMLYRILNKK